MVYVWQPNGNILTFSLSHSFLSPNTDVSSRAIFQKQNFGLENMQMEMPVSAINLAFKCQIIQLLLEEACIERPLSSRFPAKHA